MFYLCTVQTTDMAEIFGRAEMFGQPKIEPQLVADVIMIGQAPDCLSYLLLTQGEHAKLIKQTSVPAGFDFIFRQEWGLGINEEIIHRTIDTLRKEAYPPMSDYLDAKVKGNAEQEAKYLADCLVVKAKYPKFSF